MSNCVYCGGEINPQSDDTYGPCEYCSGYGCDSQCWDYHLGKHEDDGLNVDGCSMCGGLMFGDDSDLCDGCADLSAADMDEGDE